MKKDLVKKIVSISIIAVVVALVITTIILALVPKRMANPIADGYATITVYKGSAEGMYNYKANPADDLERKHNEVIDEIQKLHEDSLKDNVLSAIFQGTGSFSATVSKEYKTNAIKTIAGAEGNALVFTYLQEQVLKVNGETWSAKSTNENIIIKKDTEVEIEKIDGVKAIVKELENSNV